MIITELQEASSLIEESIAIEEFIVRRIRTGVNDARKRLGLMPHNYTGVPTGGVVSRG